jgi:hypothetical protein
LGQHAFDLPLMGHNQGITIRGERECTGPMDPLDVELSDDDLLQEVELTAALIAAANNSDAPLSTSEIDRILGIQ